MTKQDEVPPLVVWLITFVLLILSAIGFATLSFFVDDIFLLLSHSEIDALDLENGNNIFYTSLHSKITLC